MRASCSRGSLDAPPAPARPRGARRSSPRSAPAARLPGAPHAGAASPGAAGLCRQLQALEETDVLLEDTTVFRKAPPASVTAFQPIRSPQWKSGGRRSCRVLAGGVGGAQGFVASRDGIWAPGCCPSAKGYGTLAAGAENLSPDWSPGTPGGFRRASGPEVRRSWVSFKQVLTANEEAGSCVWEGSEGREIRREEKSSLEL